MLYATGPIFRLRSQKKKCSTVQFVKLAKMKIKLNLIKNIIQNLKSYNCILRIFILIKCNLSNTRSKYFIYIYLQTN